MGRSLALALIVLAAACSSGPPGAAHAAFVDSGVRVEIGWTRHSAELVATFSPTRPGFHLYSLDLPRGGVDGLGQRTDVVVTGGLRASGRAHADRVVRELRIDPLHVVLPVYPDGPVTVTLPVRRVGAHAVVTVSYGACSAATCLYPVVGHRVTLSV